MNQQQVKHLSNLLEKEKKRLIEEISDLEETGLGDTMSDSLGELSVYDNHPADIGDELFERSKDSALRDNAHVLLEQVEDALNRIDAGTYGVCGACGSDIPYARLEAMPSASLCIDCQKLADDTGESPRPLEEDILQPPFHRTFLDTANFEFVGFDGEDALQSVLKYGSSDSPQDIPGSYDYKALFPNSNEHQGLVEVSDAIPNEYYHTTRRKEDSQANSKTER